MAAAELLAIGTTVADSGDVTVAAGDTLTVALKGPSAPAVGRARVDIQIKDDEAEYWRIGYLNEGNPTVVIIGAGIYRFHRVSGNVGVFSG